MSLKIINNYACAEYYLHGPLFAGSYLQVTWWDLGQWKKKKFASNDNTFYLFVIAFISNLPFY